MANPTTNYGFVLPTPTDLVTDLPADFDVALQGVDTRLKALQPGTTSGDLAYSSATANTNVRLPIGTTNQVLSVVAGVPAWATTADVTPLTTKGDLFTFSTVDARLAVGTNGQVLTADSSEATGLKYATPAASGLTLIKNASFTAVTDTSTTFDGVYTSAFDQYLLRIKFICSGGGEFHYKVRSGSTTYSTDYQSRRMSFNGSTQTNETSGTEVAIQTGISSILSYVNIGIQPGLVSNTRTFGSWQGFSLGSGSMVVGGFQQFGTVAHDGFILSTASGTITGTAYVYGLANS